MTTTMLPPRPAEPPVRDRLRRVVQAIALLSARRPKTMIALWLAIVVGCLVAGGMAGTEQLTGTQSGVGESATPTSGSTPQACRRAPARRSSSAPRCRARRGCRRRAHPPARCEPRASPPCTTAPPPAGAPCSCRPRCAATPTTPATAPARSGRAAAAARAAVPGATIVACRRRLVQPHVRRHPRSGSQTGRADLAPDHADHPRCSRSARSSPPCVPLLLGITAVAGGDRGARRSSRTSRPSADSTGPLVVLIGLAVGVDYSLFYIRREREERRKGRGAHAALEAAAATVGRAIVVSGLTVMVAMAGLLITGLEVFASMALGTMVVVAIAVIGSLTVLPAMLALLGDRVDQRPDPAASGRRARRAAAPGAARRRGHAPPGRRARHRLLPARRARRARDADAHRPTRRLGSARATSRSCRRSTTIERAFPAPTAGAELVVTGAQLGTPRSAPACAELGREAAARRTATAPCRSRSRATGAPRVDVPMPAGARRAQRARRASASRAAVGARRSDRRRRPAARRLHRPAATATPIVVARSARARVRAAARRVPLARAGARVMGLNLLSVGAAYGVLVGRVPAPLGGGAARVHLQRLDRRLAAAVRLRDPLRALDGLHGPRARADPRGARGTGCPRREAAAEGVGATGGDGHERRARDGRRVRASSRRCGCSSCKQLGVGLAAAVLLDATLVRGVALPAAVALGRASAAGGSAGQVAGPCELRTRAAPIARAGAHPAEAGEP